VTGVLFDGLLSLDHGHEPRRDEADGQLSVTRADLAAFLNFLRT
jgi:hypothetical protein